METSLDIAGCYQEEGWAVLPIPSKDDPCWRLSWASKIPENKRGKVPFGRNWQKIRYKNYEELKRDFRPQDYVNIAVILGKPSGGLVDIDLDCDDAIAVAREVFDDAAVFGRESKPRSHYLFYCDIEKSLKWTCGKETLIELRSNGGYTVMPGSIHPSGERVRWDKFVNIPIIKPKALVIYCQYIANICKIRRGQALEYKSPKPAPVQNARFNNYLKLCHKYINMHELPDTCPYCKRKDAWKRKNNHWFCFHSGHPDDLGGVGQGCHHGDIIDIVAWESNVSRQQVIVNFHKKGY